MDSRERRRKVRAICASKAEVGVDQPREGYINHESMVSA